MQTEIDLNEFEHLLKANQDRYQNDPSWVDLRGYMFDPIWIDLRSIQVPLRECSHTFRSISVHITAFTFRSLLT